MRAIDETSLKKKYAILTEVLVGVANIRTTRSDKAHILSTDVAVLRFSHEDITHTFFAGTLHEKLK